MENKIKISQAMIVKNEEQFIKRALTWGKDIFFEQIVVDTGSTDNTIDTAESLGVKLYHFKWINDFSKAKNYAIEQCSGDWIVFTDADEYLDEENTKELLRILENIPEDVYKILCKWGYYDDSGKFVYKINENRIFKNLPNVKYVNPVHELLDFMDGYKSKYYDLKIILTRP